MIGLIAQRGAIAAILLWASPLAARDCSGDPAPLNPAVSITLDPSTHWQPRGGQVRFIVESQTKSLDSIDIAACFRWSGIDGATYLAPVTLRLVEFTPGKPSGKGIYDATVPDLKRLSSSWPERFAGEFLPWSAVVPGNFDSMGIVPLADMRIIVGGKDGDASWTADVVRQVGITSVWAARALALLAVVIALALLFISANRRNVPGKWLLRLISTRNGYASLSQFQIVLWSFLFGAGAVYVMTLSGSLLTIPSGALVLLGIAGGTTVASKIQSVNEEKAIASAAAPPVATTLPGAIASLVTSNPSAGGVALAWLAATGGGAVASYRVEYCVANSSDWRLASADIVGTSFRVTGLQPGTTYNFRVFAVNAAGVGPSSPVAIAATTAAGAPVRSPRWSDLVVTPSQPAEIDVTRVQMLFFTLISAGFVAIKLFNSYVIPDIPDSFMLLMGISNGVYLTSKFVSSD